MRLALITLLAFLSTPVRSEPAAAAYAAYAAGDYAKAVVIANEAGRAEDLALAARAINAVSYFDEGRKSARKTANEAFAVAEQAVALDPTLPEAHLQAAIALALKGARMSPVRAFLSGLAGKAREKIDVALLLDAENPWALSTSAAWRIEVARRGGGSLYGADPIKGHDEFMKARALAPDNLTIAYECALRLIADGRQGMARRRALFARRLACRGSSDKVRSGRSDARAPIQGGDRRRSRCGKSLHRGATVSKPPRIRTGGLRTAALRVTGAHDRDLQDHEH